MSWEYQRGGGKSWVSLIRRFEIAQIVVIEALGYGVDKERSPEDEKENTSEESQRQAGNSGSA